jgi:hypothetical protein
MENHNVLLTHIVSCISLHSKINDWPWVGYILLAMGYVMGAILIIFAVIVVGRLIWLMNKTF